MKHYLIFKDHEIIGTAFQKEDVAEIVKSAQKTEQLNNILGGKIYNAKYWAVLVENDMNCVGANGEFNEKWVHGDSDGFHLCNFAETEKTK